MRKFLNLLGLSMVFIGTCTPDWYGITVNWYGTMPII